jgi:hypothetical protein
MAATRTMVFVFSLVAALAGACGRSPLDDSPLGATNVTVGTGTDSTSGEPGSAGPASRPRTPTPIPCGNGSCTSGEQICCVQGQGRRRREQCVSASQGCPSASASVACVDATGCGQGLVCCESLLMAGTSCEAAESCLRAPGVALCGSDADCPAIAAHCCDLEGTGVCSAVSCPRRSSSDSGDNFEGQMD